MQHKHQRAWWSGIIGTLLVACVCVGGVWWNINPNFLTNLFPPAAPALPSKVTPEATPSKGRPVAMPTDGSVSITASPVTHIYVPASTSNAVVNSTVVPMVSNPKNFRNGVPPAGTCPEASNNSLDIYPTEAPVGFTVVYQCLTDGTPDGALKYGLSSSATGITVLAGHSSYGEAAHTPFDHLSCTASGCGPYPTAEKCAPQQAYLPGRLVYLQTEASAKQGYWFKFQITGVSCPAKGGAAAPPTRPGGLVLVTCDEVAGGDTPALDNLIVAADRVGVVKAPAGQ